MYKKFLKDLLHIQRYLSANCFGYYISTNRLDMKIREMAIISFLMLLGGIESQIKKGHIKANNNVEDIGKRLFIL